jgi:hypothetical protein
MSLAPFWGAARAMDALPPRPIPIAEPVGTVAAPPPAPLPSTQPAAKAPLPLPEQKPQPPAPESSDEEKPDGDKPCIPRPPEFLGDQAPIGSLITLPTDAFGGRGAIYVPSARYFKISDNDSPRPQTRSYFSFNYFYDLYRVVNQRAGGGIQHTRIHREVWGWEWADDEQTGSLGLRLPLNTYNAANTVPGLDGTSTDIGDLSVIFKRVLWQDTETGSLLSAGLAVTPPTGPGSFAGSNNIKVFHNTTLQPFCGWIFLADKFYLQGFTAVDAPTDLNDVVVLSNDLAAGYYLYQKPGGDLSAVVPTVELHVTTPLNHRGLLRLTDPAGTPDMVHLTGGVHFECQDRSSMGIAFVVPVAGPRLFDFEIIAQFRWRY